VQDRFYDLIKRRLKTEIQLNPPLFPWESELAEYEYESAELATSGLIPGRVWLAQLRNLNLPAAIPEGTLANILEHCQQVLQSSLKEGVQLVKAVESLFPGQSQELNDLARHMLLGAVRSDSLNLPSSYEEAPARHQMALSMLAAKEILNALTLTVSTEQAIKEHQWLTDSGLLTLETQYQTKGNARLHIQGQVPCGASITLKDQDMKSTASRSTPGYLSVELFNPKPDQLYPLEINLHEADLQPLTFAVKPVD